MGLPRKSSGVPLRRALLLAVIAPLIASLLVSRLTGAPLPSSLATGSAILVCSLLSALWVNRAAARQFAQISDAAKRDVADITEALNAHSIVAITTPGGKITYVNDKFCSISKYSREELLGQDHRIINSGTHSKEFFQDLWKTISSGNVWKGEIRNRAKDGSFYWVDTTIYPFLDELGHPRQYVAIRTDITQRKMDELQLSKFARELEEKNKELETIVYVVSHDLRAPLLNVQGFGAALERSCEQLESAVGNGDGATREKLLKVEVPRALSFIKAGITKMDALLSGFLKFSRAGRVLLNIQTVEVEKVILGSLQAMKFQIDLAHAEVKIGPIPNCIGDPTLLGQVFSNLLDNAIKYRDPERPCLVVVEGEVDGKYAVYRVRDNGIGIHKAQQEKVFELFHRLDPKGSEGEGLGLTIALRMIERQQGKITMESEPGQGTTFCISLPAS